MGAKNGTRAAAGLLLGLFLLLPKSGAVQTSSSIRGTVTDDAGRPLAAVRVGLIDQQSAVMREARTDASGRFKIEGLAPGGKFRIVAARFGYKAATLSDVTPDGEELRMALDRRLPAAGEIPSAQTPSTPTGPSSAAEESAEIQLAAKLVLLNVSVKDGGGNPVPRLQQSNFSVSEDGAAQEIVYFEEENAPLSVVLLIDVSSSMEGAPLQEAKRAALEFIEKSHSENEVALIAFNDRIRIVRTFTRDRPQLRNDIQRLSATGGTALYDAIEKAAETLVTAQYPRHVVVLLTDGKDEDSGKKFGEVERLVQSSDVVLFAVGEYAEADRRIFLKGEKYYKSPPLEVNLNPVWVLRRLTELSGGSVFFPMAGESPVALFNLIAKELRDQYVIGYIPPVHKGEPKFHSIDVRVNNPAHSEGLVVHTRRGYVN